MERMTIAALMLCWIFAMPAQAQLTLAPDGTYVGGNTATLTPDGTYVGGRTSSLAPDGTYVGGRTPTLAPDGTYCWWCQTKNQ